MALTKDDIETAIAQTENQDAIRHFVEPTHYFEDLDEPVAVAIGISKSGARGAMESTNINDIVGILRKNGIDAVSMMDKEATNPSKFVVNESGILTPFMKPSDALKATTLICDICLNANQHLNGYANLQTNQTLLYSASINALDERKNIDIQKGHPHPEKFEEVSAKYGKDIPNFIDEMVQEAIQNSEKINESKDFLENYANGYDHIWRGATLGGNPYAAIFPSNDRKVAYASPNLATSSGYTGCVPTSSGASGAQYPETNSGTHYGFLYKFKTLGDKQRYHPDTGLQTATGGHFIDATMNQNNIPSSKEDFETGILPHCNQLEAIYLHVQAKDEFDEKNIKVYKIELNDKGKAKDPRWQDFLDLHEPTDSSIRGNIAERQDTQKKEQEKNPNNAYSFEIHDNLPQKNYENEQYTSLDYLKTVAFKGQIIEEGGGKISVAGDLKLSPIEDLSTKDLSDVTVDGKLDFMQCGLISSLEHFPKTKKGITHAVFIGDLDNETTESLLCKAKGTDWVEKYTHKAEDGHLVIDGEPVIENGHQVEGKRILDFGNPAPSGTMFGIFDLPSLRMNPTSWPKDVLNVEFNCAVDFKRISSYENGASKLENLPSDEQLQDFNKMTQAIDELRKQKENTYRLRLSMPQKLDLSKYKYSDIECVGHTHITEIPPSVELLSYNNVNNMKSDEIPKNLNTISSLSFNKVSSDSINIDTLNDSSVYIENSNLNLNISGNISYFSIENSELTLRNSGEITNELRITNTKLKEGTELDLSKCSVIKLDNCTLPENITLDLSACKRIDLENVDLSKVNVIMPKEGMVNINENVKFAPDYKLDLSNCSNGFVDAFVQCGEIKLPKKIFSDPGKEINFPKGVSEIKTSFFADSGCKFNVPEHVKIIDTPNKYGKKMSLKTLKYYGLTQKQINTLRKERLLASIKKIMNKIIPSKVDKKPEEQISKKTQEKAVPKQEKNTPSKDNKARLAELSGRTGPAKTAAKTQNDTLKTQDGKAEIKPGAELKFETPMQTSDLPPAPVVVQAPSQSEYEKYASQNADSKLRKLCEDLRGKDEKLYTQVVTEWNKQYAANPPKDMAQGDQIAQNVMMQYQKDLEPLVIDQIQKDITPQNTANVDTAKLEQAKNDLQHKDPTARAEAIADLNKQAESSAPQQTTSNTNATADDKTNASQPAFAEMSEQQQKNTIKTMSLYGYNSMSQQGYINPSAKKAPTRTVHVQQNQVTNNLAISKAANDSRGSY